MFRDDKQRGLACAILTERVAQSCNSGEPFWTPEPKYNDGVPRPTEAAIEIWEGKRAVSTSESLMVRVAFEFWGGERKVTIGECLDVLDTDHLRKVGSLMQAIVSAAAIDRWIAAYMPWCKQCGKALAYEGAVYCGAGCVARAKAGR